MSRMSQALLPVGAGAVAGAIVALVIAGGNGGKTTTISRTVTDTASATATSSFPTSFSKTPGLTINQIYTKDSPGVVDIIVTSQTQGAFGTQEAEGEGAGVVYDMNGDILTDQHVVANATSVTVHFQDGYTAKGKVLGSDASTDVGVIKVNVPSDQLHPIPFADSNDAQVGDPVVAIGSPFSLPETTTAGIVSQIARSITAPNGFTITGAIQTDAAINPGNSGGPLLNALGQVIGLNDQIDTNNQTVSGEGSSSGVGFATPGNTDVRVASEIIAGHKVEHSYVGVCLQESSQGGAEIALNAGSSCAAPVAPNSPASQAGLEPGDVITAIDGHAVASTSAFISMIGNYSPGTVVTFTLKRDGSIKQIQVKLGVRPATAPTG
jgi:putative serine protease PepD